MSAHHDSSELLLLAFQYASGELSVEESHGFEAELESDIAVCEALAEAVQLIQALAESRLASTAVVPLPAGTATAVSPRSSTTLVRPTLVASSGSARFVVLSLTLLAAVLAGVLVTGRLSSPGPGRAVSDGFLPSDSGSVTRESSATEVVKLWSQLEQTDSESATEFRQETRNTDAEIDGIDVEDLIVVSAGDVEVPDWMLAAVLVAAADHPVEFERGLEAPQSPRSEIGVEEEEL